MANKLGPFVYELAPTEGFSITISAVGTGYAVIAGIDNVALNFANGVPVVITPQMMNGMGSIHTVNARCFFSVGATNNASYTITTADQNGAQLDTMTIPIVTPQPLPYQVLLQVVVGVR